MRAYPGSLAVFFFAISGLATVSFCQGSCMSEVVKCMEPIKEELFKARGLRFNTVIHSLPSTVPVCVAYQRFLDCLDATEKECQNTELPTALRNPLPKTFVPLFCDQKAEIQKYLECWSSPELTDPSLCEEHTSEEITCKTLAANLNCYTENTNRTCGEEPSKVINRIVAFNVTRSMEQRGLKCPEGIFYRRNRRR